MNFLKRMLVAVMASTLLLSSVSTDAEAGWKSKVLGGTGLAMGGAAAVGVGLIYMASKDAAYKRGAEEGAAALLRIAEELREHRIVGPRAVYDAFAKIALDDPAIEPNVLANIDDLGLDRNKYESKKAKLAAKGRGSVQIADTYGTPNGPDDDEGGSDDSSSDCWKCPEGWRLPSSEKGSWSGARGNSNWHSTDPEIISITRGNPIPFRKGYPDLSRWAVERFPVRGMTGKHAVDKNLMFEELVKVRNFKNVAEAKRWFTTNRLAFHHAGDGIHAELVPERLHMKLAHQGGSSGLRSGVLP